MITPSREIRQTYAQIRQDVISLHIRWKVIKVLYGDRRDTELHLEKFSDVLFNRLLRDDLLCEQALGIARLLDPETSKVRTPGTNERVVRPNTSLERFVNQILQINSELAGKLNEHVKNIKDSAGSAKEWRDRWAAHRDESTMRQLRTPSIPSPIILHGKQVEFALEELGKLLNEFEICYSAVNINAALLNSDELREFPSLEIFKPMPYSTFYSDEIESLIQKLKETTN